MLEAKSSMRRNEEAKRLAKSETARQEQILDWILVVARTL